MVLNAWLGCTQNPESRRGQEDKGELDSNEELDNQLCGLDQEEGGGAGPSREIKSMEVEHSRRERKLGQPFASVVPQQLCYGHCLHSS